MLPFADGVQAVFNSSGISYYRHTDWLGSSRLATDPNDNAVYDRAYAPYGETYADLTQTPDRSFTGNTQDAVKGTTGIYDFMFREHSAGMGRWLVPDPAGLAAVDITNPQTWNRYAYVGNNPLSRIDPLGLCEFSVSQQDPDTGNIYQICLDPSETRDGAQPPPKVTNLSWNFGAPLGQAGKLPPNFFKKGNWQCNKSVNGALVCTPTAPNNAPRTPAQCAGAALKKNAVSLAFDAAGVGAGFLPGGDAVVAIAQIGVGVGSTVNSALSANTTTAEGQRATGGALGSIFGIQLAALAPAAKYAGVGAKAVPVLGALVSLAGGLNDLYQTGADYQACLAGH